MSSLDDKLREILAKLEDDVVENKIPDFDLLIAQLKQAFADEINNHLETLKFSKGLIEAARKDGLMTGQEWTDVYNKMFKQIIEHEYGPEFEPPEIPKWIIKEAAKKAAGIT